jgi:hypothetical protein
MQQRAIFIVENSVSPPKRFCVSCSLLFNCWNSIVKVVLGYNWRMFQYELV